MRQPRLSIRSNQMSACPHHHQHVHLHQHQQQRQHPHQHSTHVARSGRLRNARTNVIRSSEYRNLRQVVPSLRRQRDLGKVEVVTEAAKYIDHLHKTLIKRFVACGIPDSLKDVLGTGDANELNSQHIMNLVTQMAAKQRAGQRAQQQQPSAISSSTNRPIQQLPSPQLSSNRRVSNVATQRITTTNNTTTTSAQRKSLPVAASKRCVDELSCFGAHK